MLLAFLVAMCFLGLAAYLAADAASLPARQEQLAIRRAARYGRVRTRGPAVARPHFR